MKKNLTKLRAIAFKFITFLLQLCSLHQIKIKCFFFVLKESKKTLQKICEVTFKHNPVYFFYT